MPYQVIDDNGNAVDAHFEVGESSIVFYSSSGPRGTRKPINNDYDHGLEILLGRILEARLQIEDVWVDSARIKNLPLERRRIAKPSDFNESPKELALILRRNMRGIGQEKSARTNSGNNRRRIKIKVAGRLPEIELEKALKGKRVDKASKNSARLTAAEFESVDERHLWNAVEQLRSGEISHDYGISTKYDLICEDGARLAPKAVFGAAASAALNREVLPEHFESGREKKSLKKLEAAGFTIVPKGAAAPREPEPSLSPDDLEWTEGKKRRKSHLKRERKRGAAKAKKARFRSEHGGRLFCENCGFEPSEKYGESGDACIEVHHIIPLAEIKAGQATRLEDLQCLCANCHRVVHWEMRNGEQ